jgi:hypothetical protein
MKRPVVIVVTTEMMNIFVNIIVEKITAMVATDVPQKLYQLEVR